MIESPIVNDSITNKKASKKESIYYTCLSVLHALKYVDGFDKFMVDINNQGIAAADPLNELWHIFKDGSSLCYLYNMLKTVTPITATKKDSSPAHNSKACVYHFIIGCKDNLHFPEDTLFTITEFFQNDTNGFVKVVNTVKRILDLLEEQEIISVDTLTESTCLTIESPKDMRDNVVFELLSTERKYVQDLESLQNYMREVSAQHIISQDTMHYLFGNLNALVDFQRRFLVQIEAQAAHPSQEQRFGYLFKQFEVAFSVYEPFCANLQMAQDLAIQESPKLQKLANIMSPTYELPSLLIKPIQRVCKYPLLLQELIKATPDDWKHLEEIKSGLEAIRRVTKKVNETMRIQENTVVVQDLKKRIVDDAASSNPTILVESAGSLLLHDRFTLQRHENDQSREMLVFLFQRIIIICKEIKDVNKNTITIKKKRKEGSLVVREKLLLSRIEHVKGSSASTGLYTLHLSCKGDAHNILLNCRNDEQLRKWLDVIIELKESTTKLDLSSAPQIPPMEVNSPLLDYDEDEEEYFEAETSLNNSDDEENSSTSPVFLRNRSCSYQYHRSPNEVTCRKTSLSNNNTARHFMNGVPGIALPPLPTRLPTPSNTSASTDSTQYSPSDLSFPSSPTNSYPPSPTSHNNSTTTHYNTTTSYSNDNNGILPSGVLWQQQKKHETTPTPPPPPPPCNSQSPYIRMRSQSSPNIRRPNHFCNAAPELPTLNNNNNNNNNTIQQQESKRNSNGYRYELPTTSTTAASYLLSNPQATTKIKVHYFGAIYVIVVPTDIEFAELERRIETKIKFSGNEYETSVLGLKYKDEDGDLITISSSEDVQMGFESKDPNKAVNFYVTS